MNFFLRRKQRNENLSLGFTPLEAPRMKNKLLSRAGDRRNHKLLTGFTALELMVAITIMTLTSAMVLISFTGVHERTAVNRVAQEVALAARRVQNISLSVTRIDTALGPLTAKVAGLAVVRDSADYTIFLDVNSNGVYGSGDAMVGEKGVLEGGIRIRRIGYIDPAGNPASTLVAHMISTAPEATLRFTDVSGNTLGETLEIEVGSPGGLTKTVTIRTSGQISVK